jgi:mono/diheme cytochrome c family protein
MAESKNKARWILGGGLLIAGLAWASPWDLDMIDSKAFKAYEWKMRPSIPEGSLQRHEGAVAQAGDVGTYQTDYIPAGDRIAPGTDAMANPYPVDDHTLADGKHLFQVTCAPCHGVDGKGGGPVTKNDPAAGINRFPLPAPVLSGPGSVSATRSDGYMYYTIRNGGALMPAYGVSLTDRERWAVVAYIRTLEGATYTPPAAAPTEGTPG